MQNESGDAFIDIDEMIDENEALKLYKDMLVARGLKIDDMIKSKVPHEILIEYKQKTKLSVRKMAIITGVNKDKLSRILREDRQ